NANPLVIVYLDHATRVCTGNRGCHPGNQRYSSPSSPIHVPPSCSINLHGYSLPRTVKIPLLIRLGTLTSTTSSLRTPLCEPSRPSPPIHLSRSTLVGVRVSVAGALTESPN